MQFNCDIDLIVIKWSEDHYYPSLTFSDDYVCFCQQLHKTLISNQTNRVETNGLAQAVISLDGLSSYVISIGEIIRDKKHYQTTLDDLPNKD